MARRSYKGTALPWAGAVGEKNKESPMGQSGHPASGSSGLWSRITGRQRRLSSPSSYSARSRSARCLDHRHWKRTLSRKLPVRTPLGPLLSSVKLKNGLEIERPFAFLSSVAPLRFVIEEPIGAH